MKLLLIESAGKLKKLKSILGSGWNVKATMGHVVELANDGEDSLGFTLDKEHNRVDCRYIPRGARGKKILAELRSVVRLAESVVLATDPDREGETIAWHLAQQLRLKNPTRVVYTEITEKAVRSAIAHPRPLDLNLVAAGRCRDTLDKLVGYKGSPLLWKLGNGAKSMGRVQSATLHILCQREREIQAFVPQDYWSVFVDYGEEFRAYYAGRAENPAATAAEAQTSDDAAHPKEKQVESVRVLSQEQADELVATARAHPHHVVRIDTSTTTRKPPAPFTTSSLQQAAGSRLKYSSERTMQIAQSLYEQGYITYMRTDSVQLSSDYCQQARAWLQKHDPENIPQTVARQKSKAGAQEAHEAIRPTEVDNTPDHLSAKLSQEEAGLYSLIWGRALASQCQPARLQKTQILSRSKDVFWQARGQVVTFRGYTVYWNDISSDSQLPIVQQGQQLTLKQANAEKKQTVPPSRYTEPKLVQAMEKRGIGRPSTYAPTVKVLRDRKYASLVKGYLQPTQLGLEVDEFLMRVLPKMVEPEFTAQMESALDLVADGKQDWQRYLIDWNETYFAPALATAYQSLGTVVRVATSSSIQASSPGVASKNSRASSGSIQATLTEIHCPKCEWMMLKIPCRSKKLKADHFLKCSKSECDTTMFWSDKKQGYELPYSKQQGSTQKDYTAAGISKAPSQVQKQSSSKSATTKLLLTDFPCPVCSQPLELYEYIKSNQSGQMLRCSDTIARRGDDHKNVAYFAAKGVFWSPTYGEISQPSSSNKSPSNKVNKNISKHSSADKLAKSKTIKPPVTPTTSSPATKEHPCPVCGKPLELYEYIKDGKPKQMLRCSDTIARRQEDHKNVAYFASKGVFWSPTYGEINNNQEK
ncbi:MAG TPA: type I DNA topoisomerase [Leptolyngbyaceae cyanobacterium]